MLHDKGRGGSILLPLGGKVTDCDGPRAGEDVLRLQGRTIACSRLASVETPSLRRDRQGEKS